MTFDSGNQGRREGPAARTHVLSRFQFVVDRNRRYVSHPEAEERMGELAARVPPGQKNRHQVTLVQLLTYRRLLSTEPRFSRRRGRRTGAGPGWRQRTRTRPVLAGRELGRDRLGYAQAIDGGAHDATCVTRTFAARIDASPWVFFQHGIIVGQSHLEVLPANHANGA